MLFGWHNGIFVCWCVQHLCVCVCVSEPVQRLPLLRLFLFLSFSDNVGYICRVSTQCVPEIFFAWWVRKGRANRSAILIGYRLFRGGLCSHLANEPFVVTMQSLYHGTTPLIAYAHRAFCMYRSVLCERVWYRINCTFATDTEEDTDTAHTHTHTKQQIGYVGHILPGIFDRRIL